MNISVSVISLVLVFILNNLENKVKNCYLEGNIFSRAQSLMSIYFWKKTLYLNTITCQTVLENVN